MAPFESARGRISDSLARLAERVDATLDGMTARDRKAALGLFLFVLLLITGGLGFLGKRTLDGLNSRQQALNSDLAYVQSQRSVYEEAAGRLKVAEDQLRQTQDLNFSALVDNAAGEAGVQDSIQGIKELSATTDGALEQKNHSVDINRITQDQLVNFLYALEAGGHPLKIVDTNIKVVVVSGEKRLNVRLEVATFRLAEAEAATEG